MKQAQYNIPIFEDQDMANLNDYSEKMASAIKTQIDKFGNPLVFKGIVNTLDELNLIEQNTNGDIYSVAEENKNYIWNGIAWEIYSDSTKIEAEAIVQEIVDKLKNNNTHIYGVRRNVESSDPKWERICDSKGLVANAISNGVEAQNDFDNIYPWSDIISYNYDVRGQKITAFYGEPTFKFDGSNGDVMTRFPEFWYRREQKVENGDTYEYIYIADHEVVGFIKSEQFSLGRYLISEAEGIMHSKSGQNVVNKIPSDLRNGAKLLGECWGLLDIWHWSLLQALYLVEYADYNSKNVLAKGFEFSLNKQAEKENGRCDDLGMRSGYLIKNGECSVIYRGVEDVFANYFQFCDGVNIKDGQAYVCSNSENYACDVFDGEYKKIGYMCENTNNGRREIKKVGYDIDNSIIQLPVLGGADTNTYVANTFWGNSGDTVLLVSGSHLLGNFCGLFTASYQHTSKGNRASRFFLNN